MACGASFPAYYKLTDTVAADIVVSHRILWSVLFVGLFLYLRGRWPEVREVFRQPKVLMGLSASASFIAVNWLVFVWAIANNQVLDISLGYFINPLVSIVVGLVVLHERLTAGQAGAVVIAALAVVLQAVLAGGLPWVSLVLAISFAGYGYVRKVTPVKATPGLFVETLLLFPLAVLYVLYGPEPGRRRPGAERSAGPGRAGRNGHCHRLAADLFFLGRAPAAALHDRADAVYRAVAPLSDGGLCLGRAARPDQADDLRDDLGRAGDLHL